MRIDRIRQVRTGSPRRTLARTVSGLLAMTLLAVTGLAAMVISVPGSAAAQQVIKQERRHLRHILVRTEAKADQLIQQIADGADFKTLCRRWSFDPTTKVVGGDLGEKGPVWEPPFNKAAFGIEKINGVAKAKTQYGWHVIQLLGIKEVEIKQPKRPTPKARPESKGVVNDDLSFEAASEKHAYRPGEPIQFTISMTNSTGQPIQVFNPKLWPLGLVMRYQFGRRNINVTAPWGDAEPEGGLMLELAGGETFSETFVLQDFTGKIDNWPIVRSIWRGDIYFDRLKKSYPALSQLQGFGQWERRWRYYSSPENRLNVLPDYKPEDRWFAMIHVRNAVWVEIEDPGAPGLIEYWINLVRDGYYRNVPFNQNAAGQYLLTSVPPEAPRLKNPGLTLPRDFRSKPQSPRTVSLLVDGVGKSRATKGRIGFAFDEPKTLSSRAVPVGTVFKGQQFLDWASKRFDERVKAGKSKPQVSLVNFYTYDILPDDIKELADLPLAERIQRDQAPKRPVRPQAPEPRVRLAPDLPRLEVKTSTGTFVVELYEDHAPNTAANFIQLVESGFYNGMTFHRLSKNDGNRGYIQGGSPDGTGMGGPGYRIKDEKHPDLKHERGTIAMASTYRQKDTGGSQFYICMDEQPQLDKEFTIFGHVVQGMGVVDQLEEGSVIEKVTIVRKRPHEYKVEKIQK